MPYMYVASYWVGFIVVKRRKTVVATIGELYYKIANESKGYAFLARVYPSLSTGSHFNGGGYGNMMRKYGILLDNILDAQVVDNKSSYLKI
ncbi:hypothetical protein J1N35_000585 [Gossypium stocksii]|uniref:Uncharacterized protein n=1 Tax=Gossypium stocksii TaxID=47602 RepID=A0A9D3WG09_9ROSI|nr:hypothetical protein J1N35_000585 [Gossypium stocksii]